MLTELRNRGVRDVFFVVCDGLKGLPDSVNAVFPLATVQTSSLHTARGGKVSPVTAPPGEDLCSYAPVRPSCRPCPSGWRRAA